MWVLTAPNPSIVVIYNTTYVESGLTGERNFMEIIFICKELF
jgi:hypothetical protein